MKKKASRKAGKAKRKQRKALAIAFKAVGALGALLAAGFAVVASRTALLGAARKASTPLLEKWREFRKSPSIDEAGASSMRGTNGVLRTSSVDPATTTTMGHRVSKVHS
jgi:hypothetical protein